LQYDISHISDANLSSEHKE